MAEKKSTAPFDIMLEIARVTGVTESATEQAATNWIVHAIGTVFWRIDDLVDLVRDLHCGNMNSVLFRAADHGSWPSTEEFKSQFEQSDLISRVIHELALDFATIMQRLDTTNSRPFRDLILAYVRSWGD